MIRVVRSESEVTYFLFLTILVFPLTWAHYFSWLLGPIAFLYYKSFSDEKFGFLVPGIFLGSFLLVFDSVSWTGSVFLSATAFYVLFQEALQEKALRDSAGIEVISSALAVKAPA
ncbi:hypothetical protein HZA56_03180 [Candidatus Poribacteria bacterium]|nr:hypothetical protein [Candidatus Poribacteria bacterium]